MNFRVGQKVVCIKRDAWEGARRGGEVFPTFNRIYTIRAIDVFSHETWLKFEEIDNPLHDYGEGFPVEACFRADRFRPIVERKTDISVFTKMLTPKREDA